mgnify:CR=1 FL=1|tara:strand:+ start:2433 stop:3149 length:717 start_codon:yes stop_codon:yes gene_type:complete
MRSLTVIIVTLIMAWALVATGGLIKDGLIQIRSADRFVTVKGLAERDVKADLAIWPIQFKVADNDLNNAQQELERETTLIVNFLKQNGVQDTEISVNQVMVNDAYAQQYQQNQVAARFAIDKTIMVRTTNVDAVESAAQKVGDLIGQGVLIGYNAIPQYSFTQLNDIKPQMIAAATQNAREAAQQFASDSGATVGAIRSATQGYFSINARDDMAGSPDSAALNKKVRVVSTVEYYLND